MKIFIAETDSSEVFISGEDARHLFAHRPQTGDKICCSDGVFNYKGVVGKIQKDGLFISLSNKEKIEERKTKAILIQAFLKGDKNEFVIQKATEMGIDEILFFSSDNCISKIEEKKKTQKKERFEKVAKQAAMQCGRDSLPKILDFCDFEKAILYAKKNDGVFFYENALSEGFPCLSKYFKENEIKESFAFIVGPEGGFSKAEVTKARELTVLSLGKRILRAETVPMAVLSLFLSKIGEI